MKRYTDWNWTPLAWHSFLKYVILPLGFLVSLLNIPTRISDLQDVMYTGYEWVGWAGLLFQLVALGLTVAAEIGLVRKLWWGPCCLLGLYGVNVVNGLYLVSIGSVIGSSFFMSQGFWVFIGGTLMLGLNWVYYQKRRALFSPEPVWLEAERAAAAPERTEYAGVASAPEVVQVPKAAGGYRAIYRETEPENTAPVSAGVKMPEAAKEEPEDGVALLLRLQAEEEEKRAAEALPVIPPKAPKGKGAPLWSVAALGVLCVVLAVTAGVMGWQWQKAAGQRDASNELLLEAAGQLNEKNDKILELVEERKESVKEAANLWLENKDLQDSLAFWEKNAVVMEYDSNWKPIRYHTTNCSVRETAIRKGLYAIFDYSIKDGFDVYKCVECRVAEIQD
ncbi:membrane hypothetical protein [uncultured Eubacteriales bacterium]|uniref:Uncharacterized protein n=1 Tax=uncultured Eubacteriales bacterium TaxID=172733 RepID=A0A212JJI1_9FIRM|nr:membrane hypothetical protein [uncultured Eubacteriales bacterium]